MFRIIFLFFLLASCLLLNAQTVFIADSGEVTFYSYAPLEDIKATSKQVNSIFNTANGEMAFMIPMRSFHFPKALMEEHFNEKFLETEKFPQATFKGTLDQKIDISKTGIVPVTAKGKLNIHGKEKEIDEKGQLEILPGKIILTTEFYVALKDYNITIPQLLFNNIADSVNVKLKAVYVPYKKK